MTPRHFLNIENQSTWATEQVNGFLFVALREENHSFAKTICKGDYIVTCRTDSGFADVRCVTSEKPVVVSTELNDGETFAYAIETTPVAIIEINHHIPAEPLVDRLPSACKRAQWKQSIDQSLRPLSQEDGLALVSLIVATAKAERLAVIHRPYYATNNSEWLAYA